MGKLDSGTKAGAIGRGMEWDTKWNSRIVLGQWRKCHFSFGKLSQIGVDFQDPGRYRRDAEAIILEPA